MESARCDSAALPYDHRRDAEGRPAIEQITQRIVRHAHGKWYGRMHEHLDAIGQRGLFTQFGSVRDMDDLRDPGSRTHLRGLKALLRFWHDGDDGEQTLYSLGMEARAPLPELAVELLITVARMTEWTERRGKAYFEAGLVHEIQGRGPQAWECHTLAAAADPRNPDPVLGLARLAHYAKRHDECVALTERGLELARDARSVLQWNPQARGLWPAYVLAGSLRALGRLDEARARGAAGRHEARPGARPAAPRGLPGSVIRAPVC
jgi:tetratricopeptide (TPR) repeat protein